MKRIAHHKSVQEMRENEAIINYLYASNGIYRVINNEIGLFSAEASKVPGLDNWSEGFRLTLPKKIPVELLHQIIGFFKAFCNEDYMKSKEVMVQIFWDFTKQEYFVSVPEQIVTKTFIKCERNLELEKQHLLVMDIHSHNNMGAYFSSTDDKDEKETRIYIVIGNLHEEVPEIKVRISCGGDFVQIKLSDIFGQTGEESTVELLESQVAHDFLSQTEIPLEWFKSITVR